MRRPNASAAALAVLFLTGAAPVAARQANAQGVPGGATPPQQIGAVPVEARPDEPRLARLSRLTHAGQNAEAYFSADATKVIFQATRPGESACDQIFTMNLDGTEVRRVSTGLGRTTCGYYFPDGGRILYSSTHADSPECPAPVDRSRGYVWPLHPYDIYTANPDGSDVRRLTENAGYNAEATISPDGRSIIFTSTRDGDLELYVMNADGSNVRRVTHMEGYDGGAFFSPDGRHIVWRGYHPTDEAELADYRELLASGLVRPSRVEIFIADADGSNPRQLTNNGAANFAPFFHPDGQRIIFSSNLHDPAGRGFNLYMVDTRDGSIERITHSDGFDGFPMFSPDGRLLMFGSNRGAAQPGDMNVFIAEWQELR
jgi:TolB protein